MGVPGLLLYQEKGETVRLAELPEGLWIDWEATPQSVLSTTFTALRAPEDLEKARCREKEMVGMGYFYVDVRDGRANLALMRSTKPGYWHAELVEQDVIEESELIEAAGEAGGAPKWNGHYPLPGSLRARLLRTVREVVAAGETNHA